MKSIDYRPARSERILVVDDEPWITEVISDQLGLEGFQAEATNDSSQVMDILSHQRYDLVILDVHMPPPNGLQLLKQIHSYDPSLPVVMLTAFSHAETASQAMRDGACDYIVKPHHGPQLALRVDRALERGHLLREQTKAHRLLEQTVNQQTQQLREQSRELSRILDRMRVTYQATVKALEATLDARDSGAPGHCQRVARLALQLAQRMGLSGNDLTTLEHGARLHDIGKLGIPDEILMKPGPLTDAEWQTMRQHPAIGCQIVSHVDFLQGALPIILYHHEHYDGSGYPYGLRGHEIPPLARLFSVVDAFDAQTNARPYNAVHSTARALDEIRADRGRLFDPQVVDAFVRMIEEEGVPEQDRARTTPAQAAVAA